MKNPQSKIESILFNMMAFVLIIGLILTNYKLDFAKQRANKHISNSYHNYDEIPSSLKYVDAEYSFVIDKVKEYNSYFITIGIILIISYNIRKNIL
jgi:hypothetical protein